MKALECAILLSAVFSIFCVISVSCTNSSSVEYNFLQCLSKHSQRSNPISEAIYTSKSASFSSVLQSYVRNLRFISPTTPKPLLIVAAKHESHVPATVICAKSLGLEIRIRSGGHDYEGVSYVSRNTKDFIVLDMFNLRSINIDMADESAWVQSGAILGEIFYAIYMKSKNHAFPAGVCPSIGAGGHFTGGGYGNMMRKYGLSTDNIVDAKIVNVNGKILDRKAMGEDLFWAIRGGGGSSFGVILSWKIKFVWVPATVTVFEVKRTLAQGATEILVKWQQVADKLDHDLFIRAIIKPANGTIEVSFMSLFLGNSERLLKLMSQSFPQLGLQKTDCHEMSWIQSVLYWTNYQNGTTSPEVLLNRVPKGQVFLKRKSDYVKEPISKTDLEALWKVMIEIGEVTMLWNPYGGKMSEILETATPFPHRAGTLFKIQYSVNWKEEGFESTKRYLSLMKKLYVAMTPHVSKNPRMAFYNYRDLDIGTNSKGGYDEAKVYGTKYFKCNFERLVRIKTEVDPENFFRNEQSIPTLPSKQL
ncbi:PREDICTED: reticuline oxidase-like protein [Prunus mume]|uniref:Reticuline oxidase-like protein n=1 Tax=Prunus mume TaxID=102107 RepID=A0ABM0NJE0_PRUMU|nr:PREDICTED: reticuline oxidase-like protein [Prunus mume]